MRNWYDWQEVICVSNMNGRTRKKFYDLLSDRDGDHCAFCQILATKKQLVINHIDYNNSNNNMINLQLLCRRCNHIRNSGMSGDICESYRKESEIEINRKKEPKFRKYVYKTILTKGRKKPRDLINSGAEHCQISTTTAKRYLEKLCSEEGICIQLGGFVGFDENHPLMKKEIKEYDGLTNRTS